MKSNYDVLPWFITLRRRRPMKRSPLLCFMALIYALTQPAYGAVRVGILVTDQSLFWREVERGAQEVADTLHVELVVKRAPNTASGIQAKLAAALVEQPLDVLIVNANPSFADQMSEPIARAISKGLRVVAIDSPLPKGLGATFVGHDQDAMATAAAELFSDQLEDGDEVALLRVPNVPQFTDREKKVLEVLRANHRRLIVHTDFYASSGADDTAQAEQANALLMTYPRLKAVFTSFSSATLGMMRTLSKRAQAAPIKFVGFGVAMSPEIVDAIHKGVLRGWVAQNPRENGRRAMSAAVALANGEKVPAVSYVDFLIVTEKNVNQVAARDENR